MRGIGFQALKRFVFMAGFVRVVRRSGAAIVQQLLKSLQGFWSLETPFLSRNSASAVRMFSVARVNLFFSFLPMSDADFQLAHTLNAVLGWLELGNTTEARSELESLPAKYDNNIEVLDLRWLLHARESNWEAALKIADRLVQLDPESPSGWLHRGYALRRVPNGGLQQASEVLEHAFNKFPKETTIPYNLACYACQMGNLDQARHWLVEALKRGTKPSLKAMALADSDLESLWPEIQRW